MFVCSLGVITWELFTGGLINPIEHNLQMMMQNTLNIMHGLVTKSDLDESDYFMQDMNLPILDDKECINTIAFMQKSTQMAKKRHEDVDKFIQELLCHFPGENYQRDICIEGIPLILYYYMF